MPKPTERDPDCFGQVSTNWTSGHGHAVVSGLGGDPQEMGEARPVETWAEPVRAVAAGACLPPTHSSQHQEFFQEILRRTGSHGWASPSQAG